jgi:diguanylate cyclase (GGDEF)-like protein
MLQTPRVVIVAQDSEHIARLRNPLVAAGFEVAEVATSQSLPPADVGIFFVIDELPQSSDLGRIYIGGEAARAVDASLPIDVSPRELTTVCRLLAENVRLRRQLRSTSNERDAWADEARHDSLTGLMNRRGWDAMIEQLVHQPGGIHRPLAVAIADVDNLKQLNDEHGHSVGDAALRAIAESLRAGVRQNDLIARISGDEFGILFRGLEPRQLPFVLDRVRQQVTGRSQISIGGVSSSVGDSTSLEALMAQADEALRQAKQQGRNRVCIHS